MSKFSNTKSTRLNLGPYAKAVYGALTAAGLGFFGALATALSADGASLGSLTDGQWMTAIVAALSALPLVGGTVYAATNQIAPPRSRSTQSAEIEIEEDVLV